MIKTGPKILSLGDILIRTKKEQREDREKTPFYRNNKNVSYQTRANPALISNNFKILVLFTPPPLVMQRSFFGLPPLGSCKEKSLFTEPFFHSGHIDTGHHRVRSKGFTDIKNYMRGKGTKS